MKEPQSSYKVKEIHMTLQGEGYHSGRAAVFIRMSGCNLWNGRESDRKKAICQFCDTDFVGTDGHLGGIYTATELRNIVMDLWSKSQGESPMVVFTGGEPALQVDSSLLNEFRESKIYCAIETNGTLDLPPELDWICMSPKADTLLQIEAGDELKVVYPQEGLTPGEFEHMDFKHFFLQPKDGPGLGENIQLCIDYIKQNPRWRLSLQTHKYIGIP